VTIGAGDPINLASLLDDSTTLPAGGNAVNPGNGIDDRRGLEVANVLRPTSLGHAVKLVGPDLFGGPAPDSLGIGYAGNAKHVPNFRENCNDSDPNLATNETKASAIAADPTIVAAMGLVCSNSGLQVAPVFTAAHVLVVSVNNQAPAVTAACPNPQTVPATPCRPSDSFYVRTAPNGKFQGQVLGTEANTRGYMTAATIDDGTAFSHGLALSFAATFRGTTTNYSPVTTSDQMDSTITAIKTAGAASIVYITNTSLGQVKTLVTKAKDSSTGLPMSTVVAIGNVGQTKDLWEPARGGVGALADGVIVSNLDRSFTSSSDYVNRFLPQYQLLSGGAPPIQNFHAFAFDAYNIVVDAIEKVAIKKGDDNSWLIPRQALRDQVVLRTNTGGLTSGSRTLNCNNTDASVGANPGDCSPGPSYFKVDTIACPPVSGSGTCNFKDQPLP
jgi:ABC-type branched-subunit amino acid transport system substrate-binding protein